MTESLDQERWTIVERRCSIVKSCLTLCDPMDCSTPGFSVLHYLPEFAQTHVLWISDAIQPSPPAPCRPLLLLPSIFPSIRVFSSESALPIRWPKYWSFSFSISPSNEYSELTSFRIDWFDLLSVQGALKSLLQHQFEGINSSVLNLLYGPTLTSIPSLNPLSEAASLTFLWLLWVPTC